MTPSSCLLAAAEAVFSMLRFRCSLSCLECVAAAAAVQMWKGSIYCIDIDCCLIAPQTVCGACRRSVNLHCFPQHLVDWDKYRQTCYSAKLFCWSGIHLGLRSLLQPLDTVVAKLYCADCGQQCNVCLFPMIMILKLLPGHVHTTASGANLVLMSIAKQRDCSCGKAE